MDLEQLLADPPSPHKDAHGEFVPVGLTEGPLRFIYDNVSDETVTLETGSGMSTMAFALKGGRHYAIAYHDYESERLREYAERRQVCIEKVSFIVGASQRVLPTLETPPLDIVLIDGSHGFPAPQIDFYYTASRLKVGGYLIIDDTWVWAPQILKDFLMEQKEWALVEDFYPRTVIFRKLAHGSEDLEWTEQPFVARSGYLRFVDGKHSVNQPRGSRWQRVLEHLRKGEFAQLARKLWHKLSDALSRFL